MAPSNYEVALKSEAKKVIRCFEVFKSDQRANHAASHRLGHRQRQAVGRFYYVHPAIPGIAFDTRGAAARQALEAAEAA